MDDEILQEFLAESWENLSQLDTEIVALEKEPTNADLLASIFRTIHTIKGTCGFLGLTELGSVAHSGENVLGKMRDGELAVTPDAISIVLESVD
ncbi:MAG: Hpt domain-containing protein, partial [Planctomycetaceae bacterium]|nr:Hpt domain-containing protein [Planctomycetaceae bacterium]